jgi:hypothetical protein
MRLGVEGDKFFAPGISIAAVHEDVDRQPGQVLSDAGETSLEQVVVLVRHDEDRELPAGLQRGDAIGRGFEIGPVSSATHATTRCLRSTPKFDQVTGPTTMLAAR